MVWDMTYHFIQWVYSAHAGLTTHFLKTWREALSRWGEITNHITPLQPLLCSCCISSAVDLAWEFWRSPSVWAEHI